MSTAAMAMRKNQNIVRNKIKIQSGPVSATLMLIGLVVLLGLMYLNQVTKTSFQIWRRSNPSCKLLKTIFLLMQPVFSRLLKLKRPLKQPS